VAASTPAPPVSTLDRVSARAFAVFIAALAIVGLLGFGLIQSSADPAIEVGEPLEAPDLPRLDGSGNASVADYRGDWVLVNFWASWCDPCRDEGPALERFWREHRGDGFTILGVDTQDNTEDALAFEREFGLTYPSLHDGSGDYHEDLGMTGVPESVLVDPDGEVALYRPGPFTAEDLRTQVEPLIGGAGTKESGS
jgi:cytochrome c biogenesis protein CcmG, thiol:disulfide interchange protein DsbE